MSLRSLRRKLILRSKGLFVRVLQPFRLLAEARSHLPFQGRYNGTAKFYFGYYYELLYAPCVVSDISTTNSFSRRVACDKLGLSVKGAGIAVGDD